MKEGLMNIHIFSKKKLKQKNMNEIVHSIKTHLDSNLPQTTTKK